MPTGTYFLYTCCADKRLEDKRRVLENYTKFMYLLLVFHSSNTDLKTAVRKLATETKSKLHNHLTLNITRLNLKKKNHELDTICNGTLCLPEIARCNCRSDIQFADKKKAFIICEQIYFLDNSSYGDI